MSNEEKKAKRDEDESPSVKVEDRRHWARPERDEDDDGDAEVSTRPTVVDEFRVRAEAAEAKLQEYIAAFRESQAEHERYRERLARDVDRKVELKFGSVLTELLEFLDDLDLAIAHVDGVPQAEPLARGVSLARDRLLDSLVRHGVERIAIEPDDPFDPNLAEAVEVEPVGAERDGKITKVLRAGFTLGERVIRPARVAVGRHRT